jgi:hypothetical protein
MSNWIKVRDDLHEDANVLRLSDKCRTEVEHSVGMLVRFWSWAGRQSADGTGLTITEARLDRLVNCPGFTAAMLAIGWLAGEDGNYQVPRFQRHNGKAAKARALESEAKRLRRDSDRSGKPPTKPAETVGQVSDKSDPESPTREEKRREEIVHTLSPARAREDDSPPAEGSIPRPGFPERQAVLDYASAQGWDLRSAAAFWLHYDQARSNGDRSIGANWHWWSKLELWILNDAKGVGRGPGKGAAEPKPTIADYVRPDEWTAENMTLPAPKKY